MTDYINSAVNPDVPDENNCYPWVAIKAGQYSTFTKPINLGGAFIYNRLNDASIVYESVITSNAVSVANYVPITPVNNGADQLTIYLI